MIPLIFLTLLYEVILLVSITTGWYNHEWSGWYRINSRWINREQWLLMVNNCKMQCRIFVQSYLPWWSEAIWSYMYWEDARCSMCFFWHGCCYIGGCESKLLCLFVRAQRQRWDKAWHESVSAIAIQYHRMRFCSPFPGGNVVTIVLKSTTSHDTFALYLAANVQRTSIYGSFKFIQQINIPPVRLVCFLGFSPPNHVEPKPDPVTQRFPRPRNSTVVVAVRSWVTAEAVDDRRTTSRASGQRGFLKP